MIVDARNMFKELVEWQAQIPQREYDRYNSCPVCMCELFPDPFATTNLVQLANQQEYLIQAKFEGAQLTPEYEA